MNTLTAIFALTASGAMAQSIVCPTDVPANVKLAAKEIRRYVYLRTGELLPIAETGSGIALKVDSTLSAQQYRLKSDGCSLTISGGSDVAVLYGTYAFAEKLGVRFYLHGDVIPDERVPFAIPPLDETRAPLFALRGVNPWGAHPFGIDAWSTDDYKSIFTQLTKMRMNFLGIHCYPELKNSAESTDPWVEPVVWYGLPGEFDLQGRVRKSYRARYFNTLLKPGWGQWQPKATSAFNFGGAQLFERDDWAPSIMEGYCPWPTTPEACNDVFNRMARQFKDAFTFARRLGVKTCIGTETPMTMPQALHERLKAHGKDPANPAVVHEVYEAMFKRIAASHPLDYYWLWTPEGWTWEGNKPEQYSNTVADLKLAAEALKNINAPFQLATAGWVLGPAHDRAAFDYDLPKHIPMSAISRNTGATEVDPAFGRITGREKWAIPWLESDNREGLAGVQLEAGRMRRDAADARAYGCTGLMGLHWRTDILAPNASALAQAAWDQSWNMRPAVSSWSVTGQVANYPNAAIAGTPDAPLYRSCRYDLGTIRLRAPDGQCKVTLKFCEPHFRTAGERVFDIRLQGRTVLTNLDIFARVGQFAAQDLTFHNIIVTNGALAIELVARKSLPCISAIAVEGAGFTSKINCGGPVYQDWQADTPKPRGLPCEDFYADWAQANFGLADPGKVFAAIDGKVPQVTDGGCPSGSLTPVKTPWSGVAPQFAFVEEFERLRPRIHGAGNLDRFDYWLNTFKYLRSLAQIRCALAQPDAAELARLSAEACRCLLATANTPGGLAMVVNMENHSGWGPAIAKHAAQPWPKEYQGTPRLIVPTVRSVVSRGETVNLKIIALDREPMKAVTVRVRSMGKGAWRTIPATHVARAVYEAKLVEATDDFEYDISAETAGGNQLIWPATAPRLNQTVVTTE